MRTLNELIDVDGPAWPELSAELGAAALPTVVLPVDPALARASLLQLQVTARSYLGAVTLHCGGLLLDDGWLRVLGSPAAEGSRGLPGLARANGFPPTFDSGWCPDAGLVVAYDVLGGVFALNGARPADDGRPGGPGEIVYFAPDALRWEELGAGYAGWLSWLVSGSLDQFYADLRWTGWREEIAELHGDRGLTLYPPLWSAEGRHDLAATSRRAVPMAELLGFGRESARQFDGFDPGFMGAL
ncbi:uncharacterized protein DUF2625 [Streptomyces sp. CG 926]|uniref:DUF2625 domain-containing protein n=1 Tax=Streptomyces sp. CG 926 TaxID=1882405 RepID=UPI000D6CC0D9|nr:DUF2625 domain-containing protein [Streptomyces sp. CG 926]PWK64175.1 uncharacterized protein DUF2625 [Streptomyces sp. CG 926]